MTGNLKIFALGCLLSLPLSGCAGDKCIIRESLTSREQAIDAERAREEEIAASSSLRRASLEHLTRDGPADCEQAVTEGERSTCRRALEMAHSMIEQAHAKRVAAAETAKARAPASCP